MNRYNLENSEKVFLVIKGIIFFVIVGIMLYFDIKPIITLLKLKMEISADIWLSIVCNIIFKTVTSIGAYLYLLKRKIEKLKNQ